MAIIYKATNQTNGKSYVGYDSKWPNRKQQHLQAAKSGKDWIFERAIRKYGPDNFEWTVIKEDATFEDEMFLIEKYDTFRNGYNMTLGGEGKLGHKHSEETKKLISEKAKQRKLTPERLEILRNNAKKMRGVARPDEVKSKISQAHTGKIFSEEHLKHIREANWKRDKSWMNSDEYKKKMSQSKVGEIRTDDTRKKISNARSSGKWYTNGTKTIFLPISQPIPRNFIPGRKIKEI